MRIKRVKVHAFDQTQGIAEDCTLDISTSYADDIEAAVRADHCCDNESCEIEAALDAGAPMTAACMLLGATECAHVEAVRWAHRRNRTPDFYGGLDMLHAPDWPVWERYHAEHGRECPECGACTYDDWADSCGNCLAPLSPA